MTLMNTTQIKMGDKVTVRAASDFFAKVLWVRGSEAAVREYGTNRSDVFPLSMLVKR